MAMVKKYPPLPNLDNIDLRLLRVFLAVVRNRGFSAAQLELNINQPTISTHMTQLETRLGVCLCHRGRGGFQLTEEGEVVYEAARRLFSSVEEFRAQIARHRGELVGDLHVGAVDAIITNPHLRLQGVIRDFCDIADAVRMHIYIKSPQSLQRDLVEERIHLAIAPFTKLPPTLVTVPIFAERQGLYCGDTHELYGLDDAELSVDLLPAHRYAARSYLQNWAPPHFPQLTPSAYTGDMEALALFILSGVFIGHLPRHYAAPWVERGKLRELLPDALSYQSQFYLAYRNAETSLAAERFIDLMRATFQTP